MSFEVPPVSGAEQVMPAQATRRTDKQVAATREDSAVQVDMIPSSPPAELHDQIDAAGQRVDELRSQGRELHFAYDKSTQRVQIQVRDLDGNVLRTIPPSKALEVASGASLD